MIVIVIPHPTVILNGLVHGLDRLSTLVATLPTLKDPAHFSKQRFGLEQKHKVFLFKPKSPPLSVRTPVPERQERSDQSRGVVTSVAHPIPETESQ